MGAIKDFRNGLRDNFKYKKELKQDTNALNRAHKDYYKQKSKLKNIANTEGINTARNTFRDSIKDMSRKSMNKAISEENRDVVKRYYSGLNKSNLQDIGRKSIKIGKGTALVGALGGAAYLGAKKGREDKMNGRDYYAEKQQQFYKNAIEKEALDRGFQEHMYKTSKNIAGKMLKTKNPELIATAKQRVKDAYRDVMNTAKAENLKR